MPFRRLLLRLALVLAVALGGAELAVRFLLFSGAGAAVPLSDRFRAAWRYADADTDEYWALDARLHPPVPGARPQHADPQLGWTCWAVEPRTYAHQGEAALAGRRPVLLFGDSFARCATPPADCFDGLLARSPLAADHALLNYGVGGYGLGQSYLLLRCALERHEERDPLVVLSVLVDDDLERMLVSMRQWPKPRPRLAANGELVFDPPHPGGLDGWLDDHPIGGTSFALRRVIYGSRAVPAAWRERVTGRPERNDEKRALARAMFADFANELRERGLDGFVVLFHGIPALSAPDGVWQEHFLADLLTELGLRYVSSRVAIEADRARTGRPTGAYFGAGDGGGHYNALGNEVVFGAIERAVGGDSQ